MFSVRAHPILALSQHNHHKDTMMTLNCLLPHLNSCATETVTSLVSQYKKAVFVMGWKLLKFQVIFFCLKKLIYSGNIQLFYSGNRIMESTGWEGHAVSDWEIISNLNLQ